jgi:2-polyprenyl-6-methoxyphenol hydroxylase-like FAD-dependent oxidoreductase
MKAEASDLIQEKDEIVGVRATTPDGPLEVRATLTIGADGRHSIVRDRARLDVEDLGAPMDVLWMRLPRHQTDPEKSLGYFDQGKILITIDRGDYWQCGYVIPKGTFDAIHSKGLDSFRKELATIVPFFQDRVDELRSWDDAKLLTVKVDRLTTWYRPGLLCIGDSAHAMSPVVGVGINLAIQDAVATANLLAEPLRLGRLTTADLQRVQRRREWPTRATQRLQVLIQERVIGRVLSRSAKLSLPLPLRLLRWFPILRRIPARLIGMGFRPEHVQIPEGR